MSGYRMALKECIRYIRENLLISGDLIDNEILFNVAKVGSNSFVTQDYL